MVKDEDFVDALCRTRFDAFADRVFRIVEPAINYEWNWHIGCIAEHLEACDRGEIPRLIINLPPRSLKSYLVSTAFPAWIMGKRPQTKFICTSYGFEVAEANARKCKQITMDKWYGQCFPEFKLSPLLDRLTHFETTRGGQYYAATALSPITGIGCDYMLVDDPIKPMEAFSEQVRNSTNANIRSTLLNRYNDRRTGRFIMVMQRAHVDDPTGNLIKDGGYTLLKLPAETKSKIIISLGPKTWEMPEGGLLFPTRLSRIDLDRLRLDMSELHYAGQYLEEPVPIGGGEFREEWVQFYQPGSIKPKTMNIAIIVDQAGGEELNKKKRKLSDWTAILVIGLAPDNNYYLLDGIRDRLNPTDRISTIFMLHRKWNEITGKPPKVGCEQIGLMTDAHYLNEKKRQDSYNFPVIPLGAGQRISKEERIRKLIPVMQNSRFYVPPTLIYIDSEGRKWDLVNEFIHSELATFPKSRYDDMMDCASRILDVELAMVFPKQKIGTVAKARQEASQAADDWAAW